MNALSSTPVEYSSLEADEFANISDDGDFDDDGAEELQSHDDADEPETLRDRLVRPRFSRWVSTVSKDEAKRAMFQDLFEIVEIVSHGAEAVSSERVFSVEFRMKSLEGKYSQRSHADPLCSTWDAGSLELIPNMEASLVLDDQLIVGCRYFPAAGTTSMPKLETDPAEVASSTSAGAEGSLKSRRWVNGQRLSELFGTETSAKLGGVPALLQFLGVICADSGAPANYAEALPFGLSVDLVMMGEESVEDVSVPPAPAKSRPPVQAQAYPAAPAKDLPALASSSALAGGSVSVPKKAPRPSSRGPAPGATGATAASTARSNPRASSHTRK